MLLSGKGGRGSLGTHGGEACDVAFVLAAFFKEVIPQHAMTPLLTTSGNSRSEPHSEDQLGRDKIIS
jgi:hypothetical protein